MNNYVGEITEYPYRILLCYIVASRQIFQFDRTIKHWQDCLNNVLNFFNRGALNYLVKNLNNYVMNIFKITIVQFCLGGQVRNVSQILID